MRTIMINFISGVLFIFFLAVCQAQADVLPILRDEGLPHAEDDLLLWPFFGQGNPDNGVVTEIQEQTSPEGVKFLRFSKGTTYKGGGLFFCGAAVCEKDLSRFQNGNLEFLVRVNGQLKVEVEAPKGNKSSVLINGNGPWQKISIPLSSFAVDFTRVYGPFLITAENVASTFSFDVDNVRWTVPLRNYENHTVVSIDNGQLKVNGVPFIARGVASDFTPVGKYGPAYLWSEDPVSYTADITLMKELGVNVVRLYSPPTNSAALDAFYEAGIYVIVGFPVFTKWNANNRFVDFSNPTVQQNNRDRFKEMVEDWGKHPAVLMWVMGNEVNINTDRTKMSDWYTLVENAATDVKQLEQGMDNKHLITVANADVSIIQDVTTFDTLLQHLDLWSVHLYRGKSFGRVFDDYKALNITKPFMVTEFGCDAYDKRINDENQTLQADYLEAQWQEIEQHLKRSDNTEPLVGAFVFSWRDDWWKTGNAHNQHDTACDWDNPAYADRCMNEEWWGILGITTNPDERIKREAFTRLKNLWNPPVFIRGDSNGDGLVNISDPIMTLEYLFIGGKPPACLDAADSNDTGDLDISDPIHTLFYLFVGNVVIPPPSPPQPGPDPTADNLGCGN